MHYLSHYVLSSYVDLSREREDVVITIHAKFIYNCKLKNILLDTNLMKVVSVSLPLRDKTFSAELIESAF